MRPDIESIEERLSKVVALGGNVEIDTPHKDVFLFFSRAIFDIPDLLAYIETLESENRWIPVEERLPEESGYYLCWDIIACESAIPYVAVCCLRKERGSFDSCSDLCITHWQPLPKGPEE